MNERHKDGLQKKASPEGQSIFGGKGEKSPPSFLATSVKRLSLFRRTRLLFFGNMAARRLLGWAAVFQAAFSAQPKTKNEVSEPKSLLLIRLFSGGRQPKFQQKLPDSGPNAWVFELKKAKARGPFFSKKKSKARVEKFTDRRMTIYDWPSRLPFSAKS